MRIVVWETWMVKRVSFFFSVYLPHLWHYVATRYLSHSVRLYCMFWRTQRISKLLKNVKNFYNHLSQLDIGINCRETITIVHWCSALTLFSNALYNRHVTDSNKLQCSLSASNSRDYFAQIMFECTYLLFPTRDF